MVSAVDELLQNLKETVALLREYNEQHWADWFESVYGWIADGDYYGVQCLETAFGGMGSFNDLVLQPAYPAKMSEKYIAANERLFSLRSRMLELVVQVKHESI